MVAAMTGKAQMWEADTLKYWSNNTGGFGQPDTVIADAILIEINKRILTIEKENAFFQAMILDTLPTDILPSGYMRNFKLRKVSKGESYELLLSMAYYKDQLIFLGLAKGKQFFLYYIKNELSGTIARN